MKKSGYTLLGVIIACLFMSIFLSSVVEIYILINQNLSTIQKNRNFINQIIFLDQVLSNEKYDKLQSIKLDKDKLVFKTSKTVVKISDLNINKTKFNLQNDSIYLDIESITGFEIKLRY